MKAFFGIIFMAGCVSCLVMTITPEVNHSAVSYITPEAAAAGNATTVTTTAETVTEIAIKHIIPVTSLNIDKSQLELTVGVIDTLNASITPANATHQYISWTSSDESVATVDNEGRMVYVNALKAGTAIITANADKTAACTVVVKNQNYDTGITFEQITSTPEECKGERVTFAGRVLRVFECTDETDLCIAVNDDEEKIIFVGYNHYFVPIKVLVNDIVTVNGMSVGLYTYASAQGSNITVPAVCAEEITFK